MFLKLAGQESLTLEKEVWVVLGGCRVTEC